MAQALTDTEIAEILNECRANGTASSQIDDTEQYFEIPHKLGCGYWRDIQLRPGLALSVLNVEKAQIHRHYIQQHPQTMPLNLSFYLSGGCQVDNDSFRLPEEEVVGHSYLYCLPNTAEVEEYRPGQQLKKVHIRIEPALIQGLSDRIYSLPQSLRQTIERPQRSQLYYSNRITLAQQQTLQQILQCPYQGLTRQIYLEAKVLEVLALQLDQILGLPEKPCSMPPKDLEQLHQAKERLMKNLVTPPSLSALARQVNLNERKLKSGFRQVFGTTVFGYLTQQRMEKACELLTQQYSVAGVAAAVGYTSATAFSGAFRRRYGLSPKQYQIAQRA